MQQYSDLQLWTSFGYLRVAAASPRVNVGDVKFNLKNIIGCINYAVENEVQVIVFPELCVTGYTCADLFGNDLLLNAAEDAIDTIHTHVKGKGILVVVGAPVRNNNHLYNCAVATDGNNLWVVPKTYIPNYKEFYEKRWFSSSNIVNTIDELVINLCGTKAFFGDDIIINYRNARIAIEICEDLWVPIPPSSVAAINGANVILNLSASNEVVGKHNYLVDLINHQSDHCIAAYVYASSGYGESTTDLVFSGNAIIAENGEILKEGKRFTEDTQIVIADIDVDALENERRINGSFTDGLLRFMKEYRRFEVNLHKIDYKITPLIRDIKRLPFLPSEHSHLSARCEEIVNIQTEALMRRLQFTGINKVVVGISGGLDSTLALLVAVRVFDKLKIDRKNIHGITMPGFGTSKRTHTNANKLMKHLGITSIEIPIGNAVIGHLKDILHDTVTQDVTYENAQARERTQILMDFSNRIGALVLGTGDLSELALGWATFNGDHMSMYSINASVPKTLARQLVMWFASSIDASNPDGITLRETILDVLHTPISPELTHDENPDNIKQKTEDIIGPYELHDFYLYYMLRYGYSPLKIHFIACHAFKQQYTSAQIKHWLKVFLKRFFGQQFKRSCLPDGPKVGIVSLSPRGDWRMPSDHSVNAWMLECDLIPDE